MGHGAVRARPASFLQRSPSAHSKRLSWPPGATTLHLKLPCKHFRRRRKRASQSHHDENKTATSCLTWSPQFDVRTISQPGALCDLCCKLLGVEFVPLRCYLCWPTDSTFPSGSLNQATLFPSGVVQIPRSLSCTHGYFSNATPRLTSQITAASTSATSHPSTVLRSGTKSGIFMMRSIFSSARMTSANWSRLTKSNPSLLS